jgi:hypothetical protein
MVAVSSRAIINSLLLSTLSFFIGADVGGKINISATVGVAENTLTPPKERLASA